MNNNKENKLICIRCPKGCELHITEENDEINVSGNECKLGEKYAIEETKNPRRIVSTTVKIKNARYPRLPVRTEETIPKNKIKKVIDELKNITVEAPVKHNEIIKKNIAETTVNIISERSMDRVKK